jgi:mono/diheme cytochrome c family protein
MPLVRSIAVALVATLVAPIGVQAADEQAAPGFERDVLPLLQQHCLACHGPDAQESGLRLDVRSRALAGGLEGADIVPGDSATSRMIQYVAAPETETFMPPEGPRLSAAEIDTLRAWIDAGAAWPDELANESAAIDAAHWAFHPPVRLALPAVQDVSWPRNAIDRFVLARLEQEGLAPSPEADRRTLVRRLYFDLLGLPPAPEDVATFVADDSSGAYERLVDRLLADPAYGERWARHWLDVVRFAESHGFEMNQPRPNAWPYRDWVIRALNDDLPYSDFVARQLAGDALGADEATGFLVGGPWDQVKSPDPGLTAQQRMDELHDIASTTGSAFLGLTVGCARCHNHKFDPITQRDYYALQAVLAGVQHGERPVGDAPERQAARDRLQAELSAIDERLARLEPPADPAFLADQANAAAPRPRAAVGPRRNIDRFAPIAARFVRFTVLATNQSEPCLDELEIYTAGAEPRNVALAAGGAKATASSSLAGFAIHKLEHVHDGQYGNARSWISAEPGAGWIEIELAETATIDRVVWGRDRLGEYQDRLPTAYRIEVAEQPGAWRLVATADDRRPVTAGEATPPSYSSAVTAEQAAEQQALMVARDEVERQLAALAAPPMAYAGRFAQPGVTYRLHRGEALQPREPVPPGAIAAIGLPLALEAEAPERERRLALAQWIADRHNPLTARVLVNRLWHYHFGQGLVATPSDFGANGARPTHPELLDWLAVEFVERGWRLKELHRLMVTSATYRQASRPREECLEVDAQSQLLWRWPPRRLEAEPLRDAVLAVAGTLDRTMGGPGYEAFEPNDNYVHVYTPKQQFGPREWRRMVYERKPRMELDEVFGAFDCPDAGQTAPRRNTSTTALQALNLLNSRFMLDQARRFADRLGREAGADPRARAQLAFRLAFGREPDDAELAAAAALVDEHGTTVFCRAIYNASEFVYVQ